MTLRHAHYPPEGNLSAELEHSDHTMVQSYQLTVGWPTKGLSVSKASIYIISGKFKTVA